MDPILLQKQLRDNNTDLQDYYKDIQAWGEEMKRKEALNKSSVSETPDVPLPRNKIPKTKDKSAAVEAPTSEPKPKSKAPKDFSYWEKFDVDAECDKIDKSKSDDDSDLTDEHDEATIEMAQEEKEKGNKFVKAGRWKDAIKCYTQAISCYSYDATFYANRALCHIKLEQFKNAEADCTIAIQLDDKYVKAYHRRALAREALKQYKEAEEDLVKVLVLEPENKESQKLLDKIEIILKPAPTPNKNTTKAEPTFQRPVSKFTASRQNKPVPEKGACPETVEDDGPAFKELVVERKRPEQPNQIAETKAECSGTQKKISVHTSGNPSYNIMWPAGTGPDIEVVKSFVKTPKDRSSVPLKRVEVKQSMKMPAKP